MDCDGLLPPLFCAASLRLPPQFGPPGSIRVDPLAGGACEVKDALWQLAVDQVLVKLVDSETQVRGWLLLLLTPRCCELMLQLTGDRGCETGRLRDGVLHVYERLP